MYVVMLRYNASLSRDAKESTHTHGDISREHADTWDIWRERERKRERKREIENEGGGGGERMYMFSLFLSLSLYIHMYQVQYRRLRRPF